MTLMYRQTMPEGRKYRRPFAPVNGPEGSDHRAVSGMVAGTLATAPPAGWIGEPAEEGSVPGQEGEEI